MKLIVLFVGLCVSVGVLCSVPDQARVGLANLSSSGNMLASSNNPTSNRTKRVLPLIPIFVGVVAAGAVSIAVQNSIVNNKNNRPMLPPPQPSVSESLVSANKLLNDLYKEFNHKNELCHREQNRHRRYQNSINSNCILPVIAIVVGRNYYNEIERIAAEQRNRLDTITTDVSNFGHAVTDFTTIEAPANQNHAQPIDLTITMQARLTYDIAAQDERASIGAEITNRMREMDSYRGGNRNTNDERGHLLADSLGGPSVPWNFVPQSPSVNRAVEIIGDNVGPFCWWDLEGEIRQILQEHQDHYIVWTILVGYGGLPTSRRPTGFMISVRLMTSDHQFVNSRMFMIPNVPSDACTNPNHPYWHL